jgi:hypothetical protein
VISIAPLFRDAFHLKGDGRFEGSWRRIGETIESPSLGPCVTPRAGVSSPIQDAASAAPLGTQTWIAESHVALRLLCHACLILPKSVSVV